MLNKTTITVRYERSVADFDVYRDWSDEHLLAMCALMACLTEGAESLDETRSLIAWLRERLDDGNPRILMEEIWHNRGDASFRTRVLEQACKPTAGHECDPGKVLRYEICSLLPLVIDVSGRCLKEGGRCANDATLASLMPPLTVDEEELSGIPFEHRTDYIVSCLRDGCVLPFDVLLGEESPVYDYLVHPELHLPDVEPPRELGVVRPNHKPVDPDAPLDVVGKDLPVRPSMVLKHAGVTTLGQLISMSLEELMGLRNINMLSIWEIDDLLSEYGLTIFDR